MKPEQKVKYALTMLKPIGTVNATGSYIDREGSDDRKKRQ